MTNINCCADCVYQQDGKCCYDSVLPQSPLASAPSGTNCAYQLTPNCQPEGTGTQET